MYDSFGFLNFRNFKLFAMNCNTYQLLRSCVVQKPPWSFSAPRHGKMQHLGLDVHVPKDPETSILTPLSSSCIEPAKGVARFERTVQPKGT
jgi:hypothetical protein